MADVCYGMADRNGDSNCDGEAEAVVEDVEAMAIVMDLDRRTLFVCIYNWVAVVPNIDVRNINLVSHRLEHIHVITLCHLPKCLHLILYTLISHHRLLSNATVTIQFL